MSDDPAPDCPVSEGLKTSTAPAAELRQLGWERRSVRLAGADRVASTGSTESAPSGHAISRIAVTHRGEFRLVDAAGETRASLDPALRDAARSPLDFPTVGDWVVRTLEPRHNRLVAITELLERTTVLCRRAAGPRPHPQLVAANADVLAIVITPTADADAASGQGSDPVADASGAPATPLRDRSSGASAGGGHRIEWYLTAAFSGGVRPVIVVNKVDTVADATTEATINSLKRRLGTADAQVPILATSAVEGNGLDDLAALASGGATVALSGPSGVGKSSLANCLAGAEVLPVAPLSPDGRGRHTTVQRQLIAVGGVGGGTLVDTPGLQDLIPWYGDLGLRALSGAPDGVALTFSDIAAIAHDCRFGDCSHTVEPACAVNLAVREGGLSAERLDTYLQLVADIAVDE